MSRARAFQEALQPKDAPERWRVSVKVNEDEESESGVVWYQIRTRYEGTRSTTAIRRYAEFRSLRQSVEKQRAPRVGVAAPFPSRSVLSSRLSEAALEKRLRQLEAWLRAVADARDALDDARGKQLRMFLAMEEGWHLSESAPSTPSRSVAGTPLSKGRRPEEEDDEEEDDDASGAKGGGDDEAKEPLPSPPRLPPVEGAPLTSAALEANETFERLYAEKTREVAERLAEKDAEVGALRAALADGAAAHAAALEARASAAAEALAAKDAELAAAALAEREAGT